MTDNKSLGQIYADARKRWIEDYDQRGFYDRNWREPCDEYAASAIRRAVIDECIQTIKAKRETFASEEYATGQPHSSFGERFACKSCIEALEGLKGETDG